MADEKKTDQQKTDPRPVGSAAQNTTTSNPTVNDSVSLPLADRAQTAGESSDPAVHKLLADKQALEMNRDAIDPPVDKAALKAVDERIAEVDKQLADLGYQQPTQAQRKAAEEKTLDALDPKK